jgi:hypothetical protein
MSYKVRQASRLVPESWLRKGNQKGQALTRVDIGQVLSFESCATGVSTVSLFAEDNTISCAKASELSAPRSQRPCACMLHGTWEIPLVCSKPGKPRTAVTEGKKPNAWHVRQWEVGQTHKSEETDEQKLST